MLNLLITHPGQPLIQECIHPRQHEFLLSVPQLDFCGQHDHALHDRDDQGDDAVECKD